MIKLFFLIYLLSFSSSAETEQVVDITAGEAHTCLLTNLGRVKCWGSNYAGQLGIGVSLSDYGDSTGQMGEKLPFLNLHDTYKVISLQSGHSHNCALFENNKIKCWGRNSEGQLGYGDDQNRGRDLLQMGKNLPFVDPGTDKKIKKLSLGTYHNCVLFEDGSVKCWGYNYWGQLGLNSADDLGDEANEMGENLQSLPFELKVGYKSNKIPFRWIANV